MNSDKKSSLKHIAELISQIKNLEEENLRLQQQVEQVTGELEKYKNLASKYKIEQKDVAPPKQRAKNILKFKLATVLYADAQGYGKINTEMDSNLLVDSLDEMFLQLESIINKYEIKRLRTLGDTIMCVGGIPQKNMTNPIEVVLAAIEMQYYVRDLQRAYGNDRIWDIRFGAHTGPVTAIMSGRKKIQYEVKGESVNLATRIRSFCEPGGILISEDTYELVKDLFVCEYASRMPVKYKGDIELFYVRGIKSEYSLQKKGIIPNKRFSVRFGLIQFTDLQELMLNKLERELPSYLFYHNVKHTIDVVTQAELIGIGEDVNDEELLLLKTAALFHDAGHILSYDDHEHFSTLIVREILPDYFYTQRQIDIICELIMTTKLPPVPKNKLERIMCDADLDYLGRSDMIPVSNSLYRELKEMDKIGTMRAWNKLQLKFISNHQYFTKTAQSLREVNKQKQIERIKNLIEADDAE
ncbi:MAG TPA: guanylate cyclase [Bacteroidales bacterium]|jgi:adenylate cyclase|nr:guanylate cyclase [Bacteroidales bacterium]